ncbi:hypothetical protein HY745_06630 [Candidatus Desantisbacteria bacterium]|nr:hypothetical protein [Candidatus Desantisbacteria bacterium]
MRLKNILFKLLVIIFLFNSYLQAHDNIVVHPFTLTSKGVKLLFESTGGKLKYQDSIYYELFTYFYDAIPSGYKGEKKWKILPKPHYEYEYNFDKIIKRGTLGTIREDRPDSGGELFDEMKDYSFPDGKLLYLAQEYGNPVEPSNFAKQEIAPQLSVRHHFYNPATKEGLSTGYPNQELSDILLSTKNLLNLPSLPTDLYWENTIDYGKKLWEASIEFYNEGNYPMAYLQLGKSLHLLEDMSMPSHVFNVFHIAFLASLMDNFESWSDALNPACDSNIAYLGTLNGNNIKPITSYEQSIIDLSTETYKMARIQGHLEVIHPDSVWPVREVIATGEIAEMFPEGHIQYLEYVGNIQYPLLRSWVIFDVGKFTGIADYNNEAEPDILFNEWWKADNFSGETGEYYYIEAVNRVIPLKFRNHIYNPEKKEKLAKFFADEIIPESIEYTAGLMKLWYDIVNEPPYVK